AYPPTLGPVPTAVSPRLLDESTWRRAARDHEARVAPFVAAHLERRGSGVKHPVHDFLFTYYSQRPAQLSRWHPGFGIGLAGADEYAALKGYAPHGDGVAVSTEHVASQRPLLEALRRLLAATLGRPAS